MEPEQLEAVRKAAASAGVSMQKYIWDCIEGGLAGEGNTSSEAVRRAVLEELHSTAAKLLDGHVLVPKAEFAGDEWEGMLGDSKLPPLSGV